MEKGNNFNITLYLSIKLIFTIIEIFCLIFISFFWIGTKDEWENAINNRFWEFFISRLIITFLVGIIFVGLSFLINRLFTRKLNLKLKKMFLIELLIVFIVSVFLTLYSFLTN